MFARCCAPLDIDDLKSDDFETEVLVVGKQDSVAENGQKPARDSLATGRLQRHKLDWTIAPCPMRSLRCNATAVSVDKSIYIIGGYDGKCSLATIETYDTKNKKGKKVVAEMKHPASGLTSSIIDKRVYIVGGFRGSIQQAACCTYDIDTGVWKDLPRMNYKRGGCASVVLQNELFVIGGRDELAHLDSVEVWKENNDQTKWVMLSTQMNEPRSNFAAISLKDAIYVVGGENESGILASIEKYHDGNWYQLSPMKKPRRYCALAAFKRYLVVMGGDDGVNCLNTCLLFDTETEEWRELPPMNICRSRACAVTTDDQQRIRIIGGYDGSRCLSSMETCDIYHTIPIPPDMPPQPELCLNDDQAAISAWIEHVLFAVDSYQISIHNSAKQVRSDYTYKEKKIQERIAALEKELQDNYASRDLFLNDLNVLTKKWLRLQGKRVNDAKSHLRSMGPIFNSHSQKNAEPYHPPPINPNFISKTSSSEIPDELKCPITLKVMMDPVIAADGITYERNAIEKVLACEESPISPKTNLPLSSGILIENVNIRRMCREHANLSLECREDHETGRRFG
eukprot:CAMPEP_0194208142 /NCGR_PEP_ID=MMETSP0156-20130528/6672_1 /TAXON_ID=33649 /ORGANISM="Thalassionema nitzschioides, Strain L26-B" /LENGTH=567 /DNA_ID=CAMNT_0038935043 /DNA_START=159 /DNA_END=1862 /DNA_ORIENTATION=+